MSKLKEERAILMLEDGTLFQGVSVGSSSSVTGEVVFNTSMTGYQEILTDPSYKGQIVTLTYPHIGNVGANAKDLETNKPAALGLITRQPLTEPASWRAEVNLDDWLATHNLPGIAGIDTQPANAAATRRQIFAR